MYVIDTNDKVQVERYLEMKKELEKEKGSIYPGCKHSEYFYENPDYKYNSSDICLVRIMDRLPSQDKKLSSLANEVVICKTGPEVYHALTSLCQENENLNNIKQTEYYHISTQYRSSVHFTLNGLVGSHSAGDWEGENYNVIVIEPFSYHENDTNIINVKAEDTFFKDSVQLSDDAILLVGVERAEEVMDTFKNDEYNIVFYKGDKSKAVDMCLVNMGIVPESISSKNIATSSTSSKLNKYIESKGYLSESHSNTDFCVEDDMKSRKLWKLYDDDFYDYLLQEEPNCASEIEYLKFDTPDVMLQKVEDIVTPEVCDEVAELQDEQMMKTGVAIPYRDYIAALYKIAYKDEYLSHEKEIDYIAENDNKEFNYGSFVSFKAEHLKNVIKTIGLSRYKELVDNYNDVLTRGVQSGKYPNNNEILNGAPFGYRASLEMINSKTL